MLTKKTFDAFARNPGAFRESSPADPRATTKARPMPTGDPRATTKTRPMPIGDPRATTKTRPTTTPGSRFPPSCSSLIGQACWPTIPASSGFRPSVLSYAPKALRLPLIASALDMRPKRLFFAPASVSAAHAGAAGTVPPRARRTSAAKCGLC